MGFKWDFKWFPNSVFSLAFEEIMTRFLLILTFLLLPGFVLAQSPEEVNALVKNLTSPSAAKRTAAEKGLLELGPGILPLLPETVRSPEAKMRLNRVRLELERQVAEDSLKAGVVTFPEDYTSGSATKMLALAATQTGNLIEADLPEDAVFTKPQDAAAMEFWPFLDAFCDQLHLELQALPEKKGLKLVPTDRQTSRSASRNPRAAYMQPFRLEAVQIQKTVGNAGLLRLELAWEPRIQPVFAYLKLTEGSFDGGELVKFPGTENEILIGQNDFRAFCDVPLSARLIPPKAKTLTIRGTLSAVACGARKDFTFDALDQKLDRAFTPVSVRTAALLVTFSRLRTEKTKTGTYLAATLRYRYEESHEAMESHRTWIYENDAVLRGPSGEEIASERSDLLRQTPNEIAVEIYFPMDEGALKNLSGWKLVFPRPCGIYEVEAPFELRGISLGETVQTP